LQAVDELNLAISGLESDLLSHKNNTTNAHGINTLIASLNSLSGYLQSHVNNTNAHALGQVKDTITALENGIDNINDTKIPSLIKNIQLLSNGVFRVTKYDDTYFDIDTKLEKVVTNFTYNATTKNLELSLDDSTVLTIPMSAFIDDYSGSDGTQFVVNVSSENVISVTMKDGTVTYNQLAQAVKDKLDSIYTLPQATETTLGGVKVRVTSDYPEYYSATPMEPVAIDPTTGTLHVKKWMLPTDYYNKSETETLINNAILGLLGGEY